MTTNIGMDEGDKCNRVFGYTGNGPNDVLLCSGIIKLAPVENCACHISAPCNACVNQSAYCPKCGWDSVD